MGRKRKTAGDRLVDRLKGNVAEKLAGGDLSKVWFDPAEVERLELIRATADELADLEEAWEREKADGRMMIRGSRNQDVLNPLVAEIRAQRAQLEKLTSRMWVESGAGRLTASERGQAAANSRHHGSPSGIGEIRAEMMRRWGS